MNAQEKMLFDRIKHHLKQGEYIAAIRDYETFIQRNPGVNVSAETHALIQSVYDMRQRSRPIAKRLDRFFRRLTFAALAFSAVAVAGSVNWLQIRSSRDAAVTKSHNGHSVDPNYLLLLSDKTYQRAKFQDALVYAERAQALYRAAGNDSGVGAALRYEGRCMEAQGLLQQSRQDYHASLQLTQKYGAALTSACDEENLAEVDIRLGNYEAARAELQHAMQCRSDAGDVPGIIECLRDQADLQMATERPVECRASLERALSLADEAKKPDMTAAIEGQLSSLCAKNGELDAATNYCNLALSHWATTGHPRWIASAKLKRAEIELLQGQYRLALADYNDSTTAYSSVGDGYSSAAARLIGAQALTGLHSGAAASALVMQTRQFAERAGALPLLARCDEVDATIERSAR